MTSPLAEIEKNLARLTARIEYLEKENDVLLKSSTELRKVVSSDTNDIYTVTNDLLNKRRAANNTLLNKLLEEKTSKEQSIEKLTTLFDQLSSLNSAESTVAENDDDLPIMDIREDLDEDGNITSTSVRPHNAVESHKTADESLRTASSSKDVAETESTKKDPLLNNKNEEGLPFMNIREEVDEDGNIIQGVVTPQVGGEGIESNETDIATVDDDQIMELFKDMGIVEEEDTSKQQEERPKGLSDFEKNLKNKLTKKEAAVVEKPVEPVTKAEEVQESSSTQTQTPPPHTTSAAIPQNEILQLELIADEIDEAGEDEEFDYVYADDEDCEFEEEDLDAGEDENNEDDDDDNDFEPSQNTVTNLLMSQIQNLRSRNRPKVEDLEAPKASGKSILKSANSKKTHKKSVKFNHNNLEQVKEIENVSEELKNIDNSNLKKSLFRQAREQNSSQSADTSNQDTHEQEEIVAETVKERLVVEDPEVMPKLKAGKTSRFKAMAQGLDTPRYPGLVTPVVFPDTPVQKTSRFKSERAQSSKTSASPVVEPKRNDKFDKNLQSLSQKPKTAKKGTKITISDAAVDAVPALSSEGDNADVASEEPSKSVSTTEESNIREASLDYNTLAGDMDAMAKAYVLGLYDDDIATEGEVVDKLEDFEKLNKIVELREAQKANDAISPYDPELDEASYHNDDLDEVDDELDAVEESDRQEILVDQIVEREIADDLETQDQELDSINGPLLLAGKKDISLSQAVINQQVVSEYNNLRTRLIANQNRFKKSDDEKELEPIDENGNPIKVSRFKAARLVQREDI